MLREIIIKNFKSHKDTVIELKPTTIFIGPNNSGKSSVFQAIQLIKQSIKSGQSHILIPEKPLERSIQRGANKPIHYSYPLLSIDIGNFDDVLRKGSRIMTIKLKGEIPSISRAMTERGIDNIYVDYEMAFKNNLMLSHTGKIKAGQYSISWNWNQRKAGIVEPASLRMEGINVNLQCMNQIDRPIRITTHSVPPDTSPEIQADIDDFFDTLIQTPKNLLSSIFVTSGIRGFEEQAYHLADMPSADMELMLLDDRSLATTSSLVYNRILEDKLSLWLEKFLGVGISCELKSPGKLVTVRAKKRRVRNPFVGEGLGIQQLLFMFLPIALTQLRTICIEEPEVHLHPEAQTKLVSHLLKIQKEENKQYLIATHSEHILFGFLNAIAKKDISPEQVRIYYFDKKNEATEITELSIDEQGRIPGGLPGFFDHNIKNLIEYLDALKKSE